MRNTLLILGALVGGLCFPALGDYTAVIRPNLMLLLFLSFSKVKLAWGIFRPAHWWLTLVSPPIALAAYFLLAGWNEDLASNLFLVLFAPAAVISPVLADLLRRDVAFTIGGVLVTHFVWSLLIAALLPLVTGRAISLGSLSEVLGQVFMIVGVPLVLAQVVRRYLPGLLDGVLRIGRFSIYVFILNICVACGRLSQYLRYEATVALQFSGLVALGVVAGGAVLFTAGYFLGPKGHRPESSLLVGRKNTMISIWIALTFLSPLATIGPMLYILFQNVLFAFQLNWWRRKD